MREFSLTLVAVAIGIAVALTAPGVAQGDLVAIQSKIAAVQGVAGSGVQQVDGIIFKKRIWNPACQCWCYEDDLGQVKCKRKV